jgi:hypothetical protein
VKPNDLKIGIKSIRYISRGGLSIECRDEKECQLLSEEIGKQTLRLKATKPEKKRPTIVLKNVSPDIHQTDLFENILEKNYEIKDYFENQNKDINEELKIKFKFRKSNSNSKDMYCLEVSPELRKLMLRIGRIFIGWETCKIEDSLPIIRCFKCHGFGHKSMECQTAVEKCGHCGGDHQSKDCSTERSNYKCINCSKRNLKPHHKSKCDINHSAYDKNCPSLKRIQEIVKSRISYE